LTLSANSKYLYIADNANGIKIMDISNKKNPSKLLANKLGVMPKLYQ